jgi:hypothetical protein
MGVGRTMFVDDAQITLSIIGHMTSVGFAIGLWFSVVGMGVMTELDAVLRGESR